MHIYILILPMSSHMSIYRRLALMSEAAQPFHPMRAETVTDIKSLYQCIQVFLSFPERKNISVLARLLSCTFSNVNDYSDSEIHFNKLRQF